MSSSAKPLVGAKRTPMSLEELDDVAGGLNEGDRNLVSPDASQMAQVADGAAAAEAQQNNVESLTSEQRFDQFVQDFQKDGEIDETAPQQVAALANDIAEGKLDGELKDAISIANQLDPEKDKQELGQLTTALLDRFADFDDGNRPEALASLFDQPAFQPDRLTSLAGSLMQETPRDGLLLLDAASDASTAAADTAGAETYHQQVLSFASEASRSAGGPVPFFESELTDAIKGGVDGDMLGRLADIAYDVLQATEGDKAAWQMVDLLLDVPATPEADAKLTEVLQDAVKSGELDAKVLNRLMVEGVMSADVAMGVVTGTIGATDPDGDHVTYSVSALADLLGGENANVFTVEAFKELIPGAVFDALVRSGADGSLTAAEIEIAADLLMEHPELGIGDLPEAAIDAVMIKVGQDLVADLNGGKTTLAAAFTVLRELSEAGPAAQADALIQVLRSSAGQSADWVSAARSISDTAGGALAVMIELRSDIPATAAGQSVEARQHANLTTALTAAVNSGSAVNALADAVSQGRLEIAETESVIARIGAPVSAGMSTLRQAELAAVLIERGVPQAAELVADLKAEFGAHPSPLIAALVGMPASTMSLSTILERLVVVADAADVDIADVLIRVRTEHGGAIQNIVAPVLANLIGAGELSADEARAIARSVFAAADTLVLDTKLSASDEYRRDEFKRYAAEMGEARLVLAASAVSGADAAATAQLDELRREFRALVDSGQAAQDLLKFHASHRDNWVFTPQLVTTLNLIGEAAGVFPAPLYLNALSMIRHETANDTLRGAIFSMLTGSAATQANWVQGIVHAIHEGQNASEIVAQIEKLAEHAYARAIPPNRMGTDYYNGSEAGRNLMRSVWDGIDRMVAAAGVKLLADAAAPGAPPTARTDALEWFSGQMPGGQAAILRAVQALPQPPAELATLKAMAAHTVDNFNWAGERTRVEQTITHSTFRNWSVYQAEQIRDDLNGALELAALVGESQVDVILDAARGWGVLPGGGPVASTINARDVLAAAALATLSSQGAALTTLAQGLALEVKSGETAASLIKTDLANMVTLAQIQTRVPDYTAMVATIEKAVMDASRQLGDTSAAAAIFMNSIESGSAFRGIETASPDRLNAEIDSVLNNARASNVSVDAVLSALVGRDNGPDVEANALNRLAARLADGRTLTQIMPLIENGSMSAIKAIDLMQRIAAQMQEATGTQWRLADAVKPHQSFGELIDDLLDRAETLSTRNVYNALGEAISAYGVTQIARSIGADVAAGRLSAAEAADAVADIARASRSEAASTLALAVSASKGNAALFAAEVIKLLPELVESKQIYGGNAASSLGSLRATLADQGLSLAVADRDALYALADLYVASASPGIRIPDINALFDLFDGKNPDAALVDLVDRIDSMADSIVQDELKLLVCQRIAQRVDSGALFMDMVAELDAVYRGGEPPTVKGQRYDALLDVVERATEAGAYARYYAEAMSRMVTASPSEVAKVAEMLVARAEPLLEGLAAFRLFAVAERAGSSGVGFTQWAVNENDQKTRDQILLGMQSEMATQYAERGELSAASQARFAELQNTLLQPELREVAAWRQANPDNPQRDVMSTRFCTEALSNAARYLGDIWRGLNGTEQITQALSQMGVRESTQLGRDIADNSAKWITTAGMLAKDYAAGYAAAVSKDFLGQLTSTEYIQGGLQKVAISVAISAIGYLSKEQGFRNAMGPAILAFDGVFGAMDLGKSVMNAGTNAYMRYKIDSAVAAWEGMGSVYDGLAKGDMSAVGSSLLKVADNLSSLLNMLDHRATFAAIQALGERAIQAINIAYDTIKPLVDADRDYERKHQFGIVFLPR